MPLAVASDAAVRTGVVERVVVRDKDGGVVRDLRMPFRNSVLTTYLKDCFINPSHRTVVLCCASPAPNDGGGLERTLAPHATKLFEACRATNPLGVSMPFVSNNGVPARTCCFLLSRGSAASGALAAFT